MKRLLFLLPLIVTSATAVAEPARSVTRAVDVPGIWTAGQHLYVKGNVLPSDRLTELEDWLDANGANWTVVLAENADGESFTDAGGSHFSSMDAVEHGLGKSLPALTGFGSLKHPQTGERNGAFFVIYLLERKFSYYASDVYDRRGLGEENFTGNLDAPAIRAMRGGGRVADAVRDTVAFIDGELARRLEGEAEERRRAEERVRRTRQETAASITSLRARLADAQSAIGEIRRSYPAAGGSLLTPPADVWTRHLAAAEASLTAGRSDEAAATIRSVEPPMEEFRRLLADHARGPDQLAAQQKETDALRLHEHSARAQAALLESRAALKEAVAAHANADASWAAKLAESARLLRAASLADSETRREAGELARVSARAGSLRLPSGSTEALLLMEKATGFLDKARSELASGEPAGNALRSAADSLTAAERAAAAWERKQAVTRGAMQVGGIVAGTAILVAGFIGNRRRRRIRDQATALLAAWAKAFSEKTDGLFKLMDRARTSIGSSDTLANSGWTGETASVAQRTIRDVDQLFVMSSSIDGVLDKARSLVLPRDPWGRAVNFVARKRYDDAARILGEDRIAFGPDDPLRPILQNLPGADTSEWRGLLGKKEEIEAFSLTFEELIAAFNERASRALGSLERLDGAWVRISDERQKLDAALDGVEAAEKQLHDAGGTDRLFQMEPLFTRLLPSARADQAAADLLAATDPVGAMEGPLTAGARKAADAGALCGAVRQARADILPRIREAMAALERSGRRTVWADESLTTLSNTAASIAAAAEGEAQPSAIAALTTDLTALETRIRTSVDLTKRAEESCLPEIAATDGAVRTARTQLGVELGIAPEKLLCEDDSRNPSVKLAAARAQHAAALAEIDRGDTAGAADALTACDACCAAAAALIAETRAAFAAWDENARRIAAESARLSALLPSCAEQLRRMESAWAASALTGSNGDTLSNNIRDVEAATEEARRLAAASAGQRAAGLILTAAASHHSADACHSEAETQLDEIGAHGEKLRQAAGANRTLAEELAAWRQRLAATAAQPATMQRSVDRMREVSVSLDAAISATAAAGTAANPFEAAESLQACRGAMQELEQWIAADAGLFNDAVASVREAERQLGSLTDLAARSQQDQVPDSQEIAAVVRAVPGLTESLRQCRERLDEAHGDWPALDADADAISSEAARLRGILGGELEQAEQSALALQRAASAIRALHGWSGSFGLVAGRDAGQREFQAAREALARGDYPEAARLAVLAATGAQNALDAAEAAELRERRERERRAEEARRATESRSRSAASFGSQSSFGRSPSSAGSGGSSSPSGAGRSSFNSGSGTSRSGW